MESLARERGFENFDAASPHGKNAIIKELEQTQEGRSFLFGLVEAEPDFIRIPLKRRETTGASSFGGFR